MANYVVAETLLHVCYAGAGPTTYWSVAGRKLVNICGPVLAVQRHLQHVRSTRWRLSLLLQNFAVYISTLVVLGRKVGMSARRTQFVKRLVKILCRRVPTWALVYADLCSMIRNGISRLSCQLVDTLWRSTEQFTTDCAAIKAPAIALLFPQRATAVTFYELLLKVSTSHCPQMHWAGALGCLPRGWKLRGQANQTGQHCHSTSASPPSLACCWQCPPSLSCSHNALAPTGWGPRSRKIIWCPTGWGAFSL